MSLASKLRTIICLNNRYVYSTFDKLESRWGSISSNPNCRPEMLIKDDKVNHSRQTCLLVERKFRLLSNNVLLLHKNNFKVAAYKRIVQTISGENRPAGNSNSYMVSPILPVPITPFSDKLFCFIQKRKNRNIV